MSDVIDNGAEATEESVPGQESADTVIETLEDFDESNESVDSEEGSEEVVDVEEASDEDLEEVLEDDDASEEDKEAAVEEIKRRMTLKIHGEERELNLDSDDDLELLRQMAQKGEGADSKFQEAAQMRKQMEALANLLQEDPMEAMRRIGHDPEELAQKYVEQRLEDMKLSPEQKRIKELETKLKAEEDAKEELARERAAAERMRIEEQYAEQVDMDISTALEASKLPRSPYVVDRIINTMAAAIDQGYEDITVAEVVPYVEQKMIKELQDMYAAMPEDTVEELLGKGTLDRMRKKRINTVKKAKNTAKEIKNTGQSEVRKAEAKDKKEAKPLNSKDFFKNLGSY